MANVNEMGFNDLANILNGILSQATGVEPESVVDESDFVTVAQTALKTGYDPIINAISQVLSKTIFSMRPYDMKFKQINVDNIAYGNHVRKLQPVDKPFEEDDTLKLKDGESIDMFKVNSPKVVQTNFYGQNLYQKSLTLYRNQLNSAFQSSEQFGGFVSMIMQNANDIITQAKENEARATVNNLIAGTIDLGGVQQVINVVDAYNEWCGTDLDKDTIFSNENFPNFVRWLYGFIQSTSDYLTERSAFYHAPIAGNTIMRHTPKSDQRLFLQSRICRIIESTVTSTTYHDNKLVFPQYEAVNYWQAIDNPMYIDVIPSEVDYETGEYKKGKEVKAEVLGILYDREAMGITTVDEYAAASPFNARGGYWNQYWHFIERYWNDFSENAIVFIIA